MKTTGLNFVEAVKAAKEGRKIRRATWTDNSYVVFRYNHITYEFNECCDPESPHYNCDDYLAEDWEIIAEMEFMEAFRLMKQGKDIRRLSVIGQKFWGYSYNTDVFSINDIEATDWIEVKGDQNDE